MGFSVKFMVGSSFLYSLHSQCFRNGPFIHSKSLLRLYYVPTLEKQKSTMEVANGSPCRLLPISQKYLPGGYVRSQLKFSTSTPNSRSMCQHFIIKAFKHKKMKKFYIEHPYFLQLDSTINVLLTLPLLLIYPSIHPFIHLPIHFFLTHFKISLRQKYTCPHLLQPAYHLLELSFGLLSSSFEIKFAYNEMLNS